MLLLHPLLTRADLCTFASSACGALLLLTGANIPLAQVMFVTSCNLRWWCLFLQPLAQIVHWHTLWYHPLQLARVVLYIVHINI